MSRRVEQVCVVGRDAAAWIAAISIHRAVGRSGVRVKVVELPSLQRPVDAYAAVPSLRGLHRLLGIEESVLLRATKGVPMVAQRFSNWSGAAPPFLHGFDSPPRPGGDLDFTQYWLKARLEGLKVEYEDFSLAASAAKQGRVPALSEQKEAALGAAYGYHLDGRGYTELLKQLAGASGIQTVRSRLVVPELAGERIAAVALDGGERVESDLFIDASGAEGSLIRSSPGAEFESWREVLPCDRILAASAPRLSALPAFSQVSAFHGGWIGLFPLQDRTAVVATYDSNAVTDDEVVRSLAVLARLPISGDAVVAPFEPGMMVQPWIGNCVAVGESAVALEPLDALQLHLVHSCVSHLVTLFPVAADEMPEASAYNRLIGSTARNLRDFQLAHYKLNRRFDEPLWDRVRDSRVPDSLNRKLRLFAQRGLLPIYDEESFQEPDWAAILIGHGLVADAYDPRVDSVPDEDHVGKVQQRLRDIASLVRSMPSVEEHVANVRHRRTEEVH